MTEKDPERLAEGNDTLMRSLIEEGRKELASPSQLAAVAAKLGPVLGGGGGPGGGGGATSVVRPASVAAPTAAGLGLAKWLGIAALGVATLAAVYHVVSTPEQAAIPLDVTPEGPLPNEPVAPDLAGNPSDLLAPLTAMSFPAPAAPPPISHPIEGGAPAASVRRDPNAGAELRLLTQAQDALPGDPTKALGICNDTAKRYPAGAFAQERETLAIQSLIALGRTDEAQRRADAFHVSFPDSPLGRRIDEILSSP